ncbi:TetR family transcriptional regulator C-terminal domain-containing protein [Roseivirga sp. UBA838]|uniref:TetR family transcriptional regulator C-terminal domain-containing protein n=1 Tax=Roseivirga sp. UBA838 TaxID=1947393 RepID=UPI0025799220|nr:TetR family transcriptional regulator C-terminal domain-containing protein [Roseivirga sp. UBA838]|tara:strand:- start:11740 stop:12405 length:666 start_codon:yes stop_codon:yes gene_type:complete
MEESKAAKATSKKSPDQKIRDGYIGHVLEHGKAPASIYQFIKSVKIKEEDFYNHYNSFESIEKDIWLYWFRQTVDTLKTDPVYDEYSVREKMLAFFYTFIEQLKTNRSYILQTVPRKIRPELTPYYLTTVRKSFKEWVGELLLEGEETEEVQSRPLIGKRYDEALWWQFLFVLGFWIKDESKAFEKTDAAIEKSVNLAFDLLGRGPLDAIVDFGKFLFQNR